MDKLKNAAIYVVKKSEKEDSYFLSQKIKKMKQVCKRKDIEVLHVFINSDEKEIDFAEKDTNYLKTQIEKNQIQVLILEEMEKVIPIENVELERVCLDES